MNHEEMKCWLKVEHANAFIIFTSFQCILMELHVKWKKHFVDIKNRFFLVDIFMCREIGWTEVVGLMVLVYWRIDF